MSTTLEESYKLVTQATMEQRNKLDMARHARDQQIDDLVNQKLSELKAGGRSKARPKARSRSRSKSKTRSRRK